MRVFIYEWVTGGGLADHHGPLPESLLREGLAMAQALAADTTAIDGCHAVLMRDPRASMLTAPGAELIDVASRAEHDSQFRQLVAEADATLLVAPETDAALLEAAKQAESLGAKLISPSSEFIAIAGDKLRTSETLTDAGVKIPKGLRVEPSEPLPTDFGYPAVLKPLDGAGSQDLHVVASAFDSPPAYAWPRILQAFAPGAAVSVSLLCGAGCVIALPPCKQRLTTDGRMTYLGGSTPLPSGLAVRATRLARQAVGALPTARGYVGVDLVLGPSPDGNADHVIEVNPRLTTSYTGLRAACRENLMQAMLTLVEGGLPELNFDERPLAFDADGSVYYE